MENLVRNGKDFEVIGVIANFPDAPGLKIAQQLGIKVWGIDKKSGLKSI